MDFLCSLVDLFVHSSGPFSGPFSDWGGGGGFFRAHRTPPGYTKHIQRRHTLWVWLYIHRFFSFSLLPSYLPYSTIRFARFGMALVCPNCCFQPQLLPLTALLNIAIDHCMFFDLHKSRSKIKCAILIELPRPHGKGSILVLQLVDSSMGSSCLGMIPNYRSQKTIARQLYSGTPL